MKTIYFAGGCFWGVEKAFSMVPGVVGTQCGYANGYDRIVPDYLTVCSGKFGYREAVKVEYDPGVVSLKTLLKGFFSIIDPAGFNRQGNDVGVQYGTGVFWEDSDSGRIVTEYVDGIRSEYPEFYTETKPLTNYFPAEENHQHYLDSNPGGYCHIPKHEMDSFRNLGNRLL